MQNLIFTGPPCSGKTTSARNYAQESGNLNNLLDQDKILSFLTPFAELFLEQNGVMRKDILCNEIAKISTDYKMLDCIDKIGLELDRRRISPEHLIQNINNPEFKEFKAFLVQNGIKTNLFGKVNEQALREAFDKSRDVNKILRGLINQGIERKDIIEMLNRKDFTIDNSEVLKYYVNKFLNNYNVDFNQATEKRCNSILSDITKDKDWFNTFFKSLVDYRKIMQNRRLNNNLDNNNLDIEKILAFKKMETLYTVLLTNSCEGQIISLGGGIPYFFEDKTNQPELLKYKEILKKAFENDIVCYVKPSHDKEKTKEELLDRAIKRGEDIKKHGAPQEEVEKIVENTKKEIESNLETQCHDFISDVEVFQDDDLIEQIDSILEDSKGILSSKEIKTEKENELDKMLEKNIDITKEESLTQNNIAHINDFLDNR